MWWPSTKRVPPQRRESTSAATSPTPATCQTVVANTTAHAPAITPLIDAACATHPSNHQLQRVSDTTFSSPLPRHPATADSEALCLEDLSALDLTSTRHPQLSPVSFSGDAGALPLFDVIDKLGSGGFATVWRAQRRDSGSGVVIKQMIEPFRDHKNARRTFRELLLQSAANHPNVLPVTSVHRAACSHDLFIELPQMQLDLEAALRNAMLKSRAHKQAVFFQLLCALKYLHSGGMVHRDLKPANVLLSERCELQVCDFGLATLTSSDDDAIECSDSCGSLWYRAPELLLRVARHSAAVDMWSAGCMLAELWRPGHTVLLLGASDAQQLAKIVEALGVPAAEELGAMGYAGSSVTIPSSKAASSLSSRTLAKLLAGVPAECAACIGELLSFNPALRPTATQALNHPSLQAFVAEGRRADFAAASTTFKRFELPIRDGNGWSPRVYRDYLFQHVVEAVPGGAANVGQSEEPSVAALDDNPMAA
uniref:Mitogen-activated protein kinase n=1 Tax=Coccolithus braarudii TaxID=221442 RepID=A0A7S0PYN6_9EUKA|mmetsp:Transcript_27528/g.59244  ORF Transcript_27528/g.59244 Transcript_27528/m.59244 type:complete len:482 (+) Transcript_27528:53-1498(+)